jgi:hypothetical protein
MTTIRTANARPSTCVDGGLDLDVTLDRDDGTTVDLEATLIRDHRGEWATWGSGPDHWLSRPDLLTTAEIREVRDACESAAEDTTR